LHLLMSIPDQPVSKQELLRHIWNSNFERSGNLVEVVIRRLREKIEEDPAQPTHVVTVRNVGYKFSTKGETYRGNEPSTQHSCHQASLQA
jgi:DNA-binding response OmpR family regulator